MDTDTDKDTGTGTHHPKNYGSRGSDEKDLHQRVVERNKAEEQVLQSTARDSERGSSRLGVRRPSGGTGARRHFVSFQRRICMYVCVYV